MIVFEKIKWKNFLSTGNTFTEVVLNRNSTTLIVGENGAGKSTLLDALAFVLFGKAFRKINKPQLLNSINKKDLIVEVYFDIGSNKYKIIRGMAPDIFKVYKNDKLLNQDSKAKEYQYTLERTIIKVNYKSFCQVVVLGSANYRPFMQLETYLRREVIEDLLDLQIFTIMNTLHKQNIIKNNEDIVNIGNDRKILEARIKILHEHYLEIQNNNTQLAEEKKSKILEIEDNLVKYNDELISKKKEIHDLELSIEDEETFKNKTLQLSKLKHKIEVKLENLNKDVKFFHDHDNCPTCKQVIDEGFKSKAVVEKTEEIKEINSGLDNLIKKYDETNDKIKEIMSIHKRINDTSMDMHVIKTRIHSLNDTHDNLKNEVEKINKNITEFDNAKSDQANKELIDIKKKQTDLNNNKYNQSIISSLLKDDGIKSKIIKQYIPIINKLINKYLAQMEFMCNFDLNEEFNETIKSRFRDEFSYSSFSEGEKQKIDIALLFTWRAVAKLRNSINTNILIFDEILDSSLDTNSVDYFMNIIKTLTKGENIFIISHKEQLVDKFENTIRFSKHKNFSSIDETTSGQ